MVLVRHPASQRGIDILIVDRRSLFKSVAFFVFHPLSARPSDDCDACRWRNHVPAGLSRSRKKWSPGGFGFPCLNPPLPLFPAAVSADLLPAPGASPSAKWRARGGRRSCRGVSVALWNPNLTPGESPGDLKNLEVNASGRSRQPLRKSCASARSLQRCPAILCSPLSVFGPPTRGDRPSPSPGR